MTVQFLIVFVAVGCSFVYVVWTLMPQAGRRVLAGGLLRLPLPRPLSANLQKVAQASAGCSCSGCDRAPARGGKSGNPGKAGVAPTQVLVFHPHKRP